MFMFTKLMVPSSVNARQKGISEIRANSRSRLPYGLGRQEGREKTQKEVADLLGISQSYISRLEKRIMKRLKKEIVKYE